MQTTVTIPGIHREGSAALIKDVSADIAGVSRVDVDLASKNVSMSHDENFDFQKWKREIEALNETYKVLPA